MTAPFIAPTKRDAGPLRAPAVHLDAPIGPNDYCDRCRVARAVTRATVKGTALYLCGNHTRAHRAALEADPSIFLHVEEVKA